eukprot:CFRG0906T1
MSFSIGEVQTTSTPNKGDSQVEDTSTQADANVILNNNSETHSCSSLSPLSTSSCTSSQTHFNPEITNSSRNRCRRSPNSPARHGSRHRKPSLLAGVKGNYGIDEVYENQRRGLFEGFRNGELLPTDPSQYSDCEGRVVGVGDVGLGNVACPEGWQWTGEWTLDLDKECFDEDGWEYATLGGLKAIWHKLCKPSHCVRRRRWIRNRVRKLNLEDIEKGNDSKVDVGMTSLSQAYRTSNADKRIAADVGYGVGLNTDIKYNSQSSSRSQSPSQFNLPVDTHPTSEASNISTDHADSLDSPNYETTTKGLFSNGRGEENDMVDRTLSKVALVQSPPVTSVKVVLSTDSSSVDQVSYDLPNNNINSANTGSSVSNLIDIEESGGNDEYGSSEISKILEGVKEDEKRKYDSGQPVDMRMDNDPLTMNSLASTLKQSMSPSPTLLAFIDKIKEITSPNAQNKRDASNKLSEGARLLRRYQVGEPGDDSRLFPLTDQELQFLAMEPHMEQQKLLEEAMRSKAKKVAVAEQKDVPAMSKMASLFKRNNAKDSGGTTTIELSGSINEMENFSSQRSEIQDKNTESYTTHTYEQTQTLLTPVQSPPPHSKHSSEQVHNQYKDDDSDGPHAHATPVASTTKVKAHLVRSTLPPLVDSNAIPSLSDDLNTNVSNKCNGNTSSRAVAHPSVNSVHIVSSATNDAEGKSKREIEETKHASDIVLTIGELQKVKKNTGASVSVGVSASGGGVVDVNNSGCKGGRENEAESEDRNISLYPEDVDASVNSLSKNGRGVKKNIGMPPQPHLRKEVGRWESGSVSDDGGNVRDRVRDHNRKGLGEVFMGAKSVKNYDSSHARTHIESKSALNLSAEYEQTKSLVPNIQINKEENERAKGEEETSAPVSVSPGADEHEQGRRVTGKAAEVKITVYENQRSGLFGSYSTMWLMPGVDKRGQWSLKDGTQSISLQQHKLTPGWEWTGDWVYNTNPKKYDADGWQYAFSFWSTTWNNSPKAAFYVRRRKWSRVRRMILSSYDTPNDVGNDNAFDSFSNDMRLKSKSNSVGVKEMFPSMQALRTNGRKVTGTQCRATQQQGSVVMSLDWVHCVLIMIALAFACVSLLIQCEIERRWETREGFAFHAILHAAKYGHI